VEKLPDALKLQMRTEMMQVVMKYTQPIPPSHFVQPHYFHQRPDRNMPRIGEKQNFMEMTDVSRLPTTHQQHPLQHRLLLSAPPLAIWIWQIYLYDN
jgi:hypothetical protein